MTRILDGIRTRLEPVPGQARSRPMRNGVITLVLCALVVYACVTRFDIPFVEDGGEVVRAEFRSTNDLQPGDAVRVRGIDVGEVKEIELNESTRSAVVTMRLERDVAVRRDASATIYWRTLLGGHMYVELDPGSPSATELGAGVIPAERTRSQVEWDQFFQAYDGPTTRFQQAIFRDFGRGLADREATGRAIDALSPGFSTIERGLEPMRGRVPDDLSALVASTGRLTRALAADERRLAGFFDHAAGTFGAVARRRTELGQMIETAPAAMDASVAALTHMTTTLDGLDPLVADFRPAARRLDPAAQAAIPALRQADALLRESRPLFRRLGPTFALLATTGRAAVPLMRDLEPTLDRLDRELLPSLREPDPDTGFPTFQMIGPTAAVAADAAGEFDKNGHILRFPNQPEDSSGSGGDGARTACQGLIADPRPGERRRCAALRQAFPFLPTGRAR